MAAIEIQDLASAPGALARSDSWPANVTAGRATRARDPRRARGRGGVGHLDCCARRAPAG